MFKFPLLVVIIFISASWSEAHEDHPTESPQEPQSIENASEPEANKKLHKIIITGKDGYFDSHRHDTTEKIEVLTKDRIDKSNATSLNEAMDRMPGVDSQDYCVNCGAKRISINGLRGDHTSVLVDGIPLYSAVSSVYGFDAIPMQSVEEIEVKRGTGAALINPEAIGGAINIITLMPKESGTRASGSYGTFKSRNAELLHNYVSDNYKLSIGGEFNRQEPWDVDKNGFAESPWKSRYSLFLKQTLNLSENTQWSTRLSFTEMEIVGGNMNHQRLERPIPFQASDTDFVDGDVRKPYTGPLDRITEYIHVKRSEATSKVITLINSNNSLEWNFGAAIYNQDSFYMHAYDYLTEDQTIYNDIKWRHQINNEQALLLGVAYRFENLRSESEVMYQANNVPKDNFDYHAYSLFAQHEWFLPYDIEVSSALRSEKLKNRWSYLGELDRDVVSPRLLLKWEPNEHLSHQLAYGYGYRMPLTSIESAHGAYDGFVVGITELEKSQSVVYSTSYNTPTFYVTPSVHYTHLKNMSYPLEPLVPHSGPLTFINDTETHDLWVYDILTGFKPMHGMLIEVGYETYQYPDDYKNKLPTAAIEKRINVRSEYEHNGYTFIISGFWVGSRDLSKYNEYPNHYNVSQGLLGVADQKWQRSPNYWQWDSSLSKKWQSMELTLGVQNIFNYTQTKAGDSPAMWHLHGNHTHLDNRHVWGPNRGREAYLKLTYNF
jgi:outer membrane receptor protein involved in Fe transport